MDDDRVIVDVAGGNAEMINDTRLLRGWSCAGHSSVDPGMV